MKRDRIAPSPVVAAMMERAFYPHAPDRVELRQTHISHVFLAGEHVYKVKKPVRFAFLDFSTLERRLRFSREELRLNRRLAPDVYLGVAPILPKERGFQLGPEESEPPEAVEYAVHMRRLPEARALDRLLAQGRIGEPAIRRIVDTIVPFHREASTRAAKRWGSSTAIRELVRENWTETERFVGKTLSAERFAEIRGFFDRALVDLAPRMDERMRAGRVREGHGDLRAEHIVLADGGVSIFDAVEFSERLRTVDVASEIAFLVMDLDFLGAPLLARRLAELYAEATGDPDLFVVLPFYACHRAAIRGKVESLKSEETEVSSAERDNARARAGRYFQLAARYTRAPSASALVLVCGLPASGKTTVARALADVTGFSVFHSDGVRKRLAGADPGARTEEAMLSILYGEAFQRATYDKLFACAAESLDVLLGAIVDATFRERRERQRFVELARSRGVLALVVECRVGENQVRRRMEARAQSERSLSDATLEVYLRARETFEPIGGEPGASVIVVDGAAPAEATAESIVEKLRSVR